MIRSLLGSLAATLVFASAAHAQYSRLDVDDEGRLSTRIGYADLDLNSAAGAHAFMVRLGRAADMVCPKSTVSLAAGVAEREACMKTAMHDAMMATHAPLIVSMAQDRTRAEVASR